MFAMVCNHVRLLAGAAPRLLLASNSPSSPFKVCFSLPPRAEVTTTTGFHYAKLRSGEKVADSVCSSDGAYPRTWTPWEGFGVWYRIVPTDEQHPGVGGELFQRGVEVVAPCDVTLSPRGMTSRPQSAQRRQCNFRVSAGKKSFWGKLSQGKVRAGSAAVGQEGMGETGKRGANERAEPRRAKRFSTVPLRPWMRVAPAVPFPSDLCASRKGL